MVERHHTLLHRDLCKPPPYLMGAHAQTIVPALWFGGHREGALARRERWVTPDDDFVDVDRVPNAAATSTTNAAAGAVSRLGRFCGQSLRTGLCTLLHTRVSRLQCHISGDAPGL